MAGGVAVGRYPPPLHRLSGYEHHQLFLPPLIPKSFSFGVHAKPPLSPPNVALRGREERGRQRARVGEREGGREREGVYENRNSISPKGSNL